ncbi:hypothetical protein JMK10_21600 [Rhodovulum sulfidophilum]|uniref:hypothetical protein n=1 Tax=Rhodovulum sulfidophilum TaxID=35806 RepID=UPI001922B752|nr:hypothetical protein [Rhodovulum sulfidophilum]MBL3575683.1 hypothetical protein [Rhodovulum sulfidophilum]MCE8430070.1 hypothetical protein [Rhodovulum sulfidophilum]MCF4119245.1 hypothetical protein [Rhodovulum sulfidophilum]
MAEFGIKGPLVGSTVSAQIRTRSTGRALLDIDQTNWGVIPEEPTPPVGATLEVDVDLGVVHPIPFSAFGGNVVSASIVEQPEAVPVHVSVLDGNILINSVDWPEVRQDTTRKKDENGKDIFTLYAGSDQDDVTFNPLTYMVNKKEKSAPGFSFTFRVLVTRSGEDPVTVKVTATPVAHLTLSGWSAGRGYKLAVDENDATLLEPGERHADIYVSLSAAAYSKDDVISEIGSWLEVGQVEHYIATQLTPGGGNVSGHEVAYNPMTYYGSQAKPFLPDAVKGIVSELLNSHGFDTVYLHYERGYDYSAVPKAFAAFPGGQGILHPNAILAWGEGDQPVMYRTFINGSVKKHGLILRDMAFTFPSEVGGGGVSDLLVENCTSLAKIYLYGQHLGEVPRVTVRNCILPQAFDPSEVKDGFWPGNYRPSNLKPGGGCNGIIIQGNFIAWGGAGPEYLNTLGPDGVPSKDDTYGYEQIGSDPRWGLNGFATPGPNLLTHPIYFDSFTRHILFRDNFVFGSGGSLIQLRGGAVMRQCAFTYGNQAFMFGQGTFDNYAPTQFPDRADGHRSLGQDVVITHAGFMDGPNAGNAMNWGLQVSAPLVPLERCLVLHDLNPNDPSDASRLTSDWNGDLHNRADGLVYARGSYGSGAPFEHWKGRERDIAISWGEQTYNPDGLDLSDVNDATIFRWYDAKRGNAPDTTTDIMEIYWWLREHEGPEIQALVRDFIAFMQAPLGIAPAWRTSAGPCSFVPDLAEDGCRWDNPNNWGGDLIPGSFAADTAALGGHKVFFQDHTLTVAGLDLGAGGHVHAVNGRLNVSAAPTCTGGGAITTDESGQVWIGGYVGTAPLALTVKGGRFANTGTFSGPADIRIDGSTDPHGVAEFLCAYGEASMTIRSGRSMEIMGGGPRVGFDGLDGAQARLSFEGGAELRFVAENGRLATIREFRSGVNGTQATDVVSSVDLGGAALVLDLTGVTAGSHVLIAADSVTGSFGSVSGAIDPGLDATVAVSATSVSLTVTAGSGRIVLA